MNKTIGVDEIGRIAEPNNYALSSISYNRLHMGGKKHSFDLLDLADSKDNNFARLDEVYNPVN